MTNHAPKSWFLRSVQPMIAEIKSTGAERMVHRARVLTAFADFMILGGINNAKRTMKGIPFRSTSRELTSGVFETFETPYAYALWRALCFTVRRHGDPFKNPEMDWSVGCRRYGVKQRDAYFVWKYLSYKARKALVSFASDRTVILRPLPVKHTKEMIAQLRKYAAYLAHRKLRFVWNNDAGTSADDLISDMLAQGVSAIRKMEFTGNSNGVRHNRLYITNYAARAVHNRSISLIEYYTSGARSPVERTEVGVEGEKLPEYRRLTLSMDLRMNNSDNQDTDDATFHGVLEAPINAKGIINEVFINEIRARFQGLASTILQILMDGHVDHDFEEYLERKYKARSCALCPEVLLKEACDFFNVDHEVLTASLRRMLGRKANGQLRSKDSSLLSVEKIPTPYKKLPDCSE